MHPALKAMKAPGDPRRGWHVLQIMITRACRKSCFSCTQGSNLAGKPAFMSVEDFERAVISLDGFPGTIGVFGGQPTLHPQFPEICRIMRARVSYLHRGLWTNSLSGHGKTCRITYNPARSNLNVHMDRADYDEIARDWPEALTARREHIENGLTTDSVHTAPFVAMQDVMPDEDARWKIISECDVNQTWSAAIGHIPGRGLRAYFCELAYAQAALHADDPEWPDLGMTVEPGWWRRPIEDFAGQVYLHCHSCGIPLRRPGQAAIGGTTEEFTQTHAFIARPKARGREVAFVDAVALERSARPATEYLPGVTPC